MLIQNDSAQEVKT